MAKGTRWPISAFKDKKLIEVNGVFVKADSQVAKGKVEKLKPLDVTHLDSAIPKVTPEELIKLYNESGFLVVSASPGKPFRLPNGEYIYIKHSFDINPCPAPRMTRRDKYYLDPNHPDPKKRQRKCVTKYFSWKTAFTIMATQQGYALTEVLRVLFIIPIPEGLSEVKRQDRIGQKHHIRPDTDNYTKAIKDSFGVDDGFVWDERSVKIWGEKGQIIIF